MLKFPVPRLVSAAKFQVYFHSRVLVIHLYAPPVPDFLRADVLRLVAPFHVLHSF